MRRKPTIRCPTVRSPRVHDCQACVDEARADDWTQTVAQLAAGQLLSNPAALRAAHDHLADCDACTHALKACLGYGALVAHQHRRLNQELARVGLYTLAVTLGLIIMLAVSRFRWPL